ncbi:MAG: hypothetical protein WC356_01155 [Candidatus Micrarchaeia archaeon]|jgi:Zn-finger protein
MTNTTIMIDLEIKSALDSLKIHHRESYKEIIEKLINFYLDEKKLKNFVDEAQKEKIKELWDNEWDEIWNTA